MLLALLVVAGLSARRRKTARRRTSKAVGERRKEYNRIIMPGIGISRAQAQALYDAQIQFVNFRLQQLYHKFLPDVVKAVYGSLPVEFQNVAFNAPYMMQIVGAPTGHPSGNVSSVISTGNPQRMIQTAAQ